VAVRVPAPAQRARPDRHRTGRHRVPGLGRRPVRRHHGNRLRVHGVQARRADVQALRGRRCDCRQVDGVFAIV